jgi:hypothetical protein
MANTIVTLSAGDITRKALSILHNELVFCKTIDRQYDDRFARSGAKNGGTLLIRNPNEFAVRTGSVMDTQDLLETTQTLTVATQLGVDINFSSVELTLSLDDFAERILQPAMARLAAEVDKTVINGCYPYVWNYVYGTLGTQPTIADVLSARAKLAQSLTPSGEKIIMCDSLASNAIMASAASYFHSGSQIEKQYEQGLVGNLHGFKFYETEMTPTHENGTRTDTTPVVSTTSLVTLTTATAGGHNVISMVGNATGTTILPGNIFTIAGVRQVNPETKTTMSNLQQFVVTATVAASTSACNISVEPAIYTSGAKQTVVITTAAASALVTHLAFGSAGVSYRNSLAYHPKAFTMVTADLEMPKGVDFAAREVYDGVSLRVVRNYDITNDKFPCRVDVLFGYKTVRNGWACRLNA